MRKINSIKNEKLKYAYRLMTVSGLRVSEVAALKKEDIAINGNQITIDVKNGKGGEPGTVHCMSDDYLSQRLADYMNKKEDEKLFYGADTMKHKAMELGIECHDLRRIAAITYRQNQRDLGRSLEEANGDVQKFLRHVRFSTTKRYLFNRKLKIKRKEDADEPEED